MPIVIRDLHGWYGESHVLHGIDLLVPPGQVITLLGRNGAGKTTILRAVMGLLARRSGSICIQGRETIHSASHLIARLGVGYCPEERGIFSGLSVQENLRLPPRLKTSAYSEQRVYELFPNLQERRRSLGTSLSGGEQQMLAIARILRAGFRVLLLDEPTEGLAPVIVQHIGHAIQRLSEGGFTIVLVEQNFRFAVALADRHHVIEQGRLVDTLERNEASSDVERLQRYLSA